MDNFALLQQTRQPWLDLDSLKAKFLELSSQMHPDKVHSEGESQRNEAGDRYAELNAAYNCLRHPKERLLHLLQLETGAKPPDIQSLPPGTMDLMMEVGKTCREADQFLAAKSQTTSPLLKVQMFEKGMAWTDKLNQLRQQIDLRREALWAELKSMNDVWTAAPIPGSAGRMSALPLERLEEAYRICSYTARWTEQIQERLVQLSF
jgi:DnaJ-domain-containing protein 1